MHSAVKDNKQLWNVNQMATKRIFIKWKQDKSNKVIKHSTGTQFLKYNYTNNIYCV